MKKGHTSTKVSERQESKRKKCTSYVNQGGSTLVNATFR
jgi:hypothetical protein